MEQKVLVGPTRFDQYGPEIVYMQLSSATCGKRQELSIRPHLAKQLRLQAVCRHQANGKASLDLTALHNKQYFWFCTDCEGRFISQKMDRQVGIEKSPTRDVSSPHRILAYEREC